MKILVFIKDVYDVKVPLAWDERTGRLKGERNAVMLNPADRSAIGCALEIKGLAPDTEITLIHLGPPSAESILREGLAMGCNEAVRVWDEETDVLHTEAKSLVLSEVARILTFDLVLTGARSQDTGAGQLGLLLSSRLAIPCVGGATSLRPSGESSVVVTKELSDGSVEYLESTMPLVVTMAPEERHLESPSFAALRDAAERPIPCIDFAELGISTSAVRAAESILAYGPLRLPTSRFRYIPAPDSALPAFERRLQLLQGSMKKRQGRTVTGNEDEIVETLFQILLDEGWLDEPCGNS